MSLSLEQMEELAVFLRLEGFQAKVIEDYEEICGEPCHGIATNANLAVIGWSVGVIWWGNSINWTHLPSRSVSHETLGTVVF